MMVKCAKQSPRICDEGIIHWYEGDTFILTFELTFTNESGDIIETNEKDRITICFNDSTGKLIYKTEVTGTTTLDVVINEEVTKRFKAGKYSYCVKRCSDFITTIMKMNEVLVE